MPKVYRYKGRIYCERDLSFEDDKYEGDLYDLYWELKKDDLANESTTYYATAYLERDSYYETAEELVEEEFADLCIGEVNDD